MRSLLRALTMMVANRRNCSDISHRMERCVRALWPSPEVFHEYLHPLVTENQKQDILVDVDCSFGTGPGNGRRETAVY